MHQREIRLALLRNGHLPIPVQGKRPLLQNWQNLDPDEEMIARWGDQGDNTGVLCRRTAALDIDFDDAAAVQIVLAVVRDRIRGLILERTGRAPKCAMPMYVPEPFKKVIRKFTAPDGRVHKIEFLCDGQQFVVAGTHPDTGSPYTWRDRDLMRTSLMELPVVRESDIEALLQRCAEELKVKLGWIDISNVAPDSSGADPNNIVQFTPIAERVEKMQYGGEFPINDTLLVYSGDQLRDGLSLRASHSGLSFARTEGLRGNSRRPPGAPDLGLDTDAPRRSRRWFTGTLRSTTGSSHVLWRHSPTRC